MLETHLPGQGCHRVKARGRVEGEEGGQGGRADQALVMQVLVVANVEGRPQVGFLSPIQPAKGIVIGA